MKKIIDDNYKSIVKRGLINNQTNMKDFFSKLEEEVIEFDVAVFGGIQRHINEELADIILVCLNIAKHYDIDIETELKNKIKINYKR